MYFNVSVWIIRYTILEYWICIYRFVSFYNVQNFKMRKWYKRKEIKLEYTAISAKKYKLFEDVSISGLSKVNVIIGKNNSGKSSLLDIVGAAYDVTNYINLKNEIEEMALNLMLPRFSHLSLNCSEFNSVCQDKYLSVTISITRNKKKFREEG